MDARLYATGPMGLAADFGAAADERPRRAGARPRRPPDARQPAAQPRDARRSSTSSTRRWRRWRRPRPGDVRAVVVTGAGERAFSAGSHVGEFEAQRGAGRPGAPRAASRASRAAWPSCRCRPSPPSRATPWAAAWSSPCAATCASPPSGPGSACRRCAWRSRPAPAARSGCRGSSAPARAKELILTGQVLTADGGASGSGSSTRSCRPARPSPRRHGDRRGDRPARPARRARGEAPHRPGDRDRTSTPAWRPSSTHRERVFASDDMLEGAAVVLRASATRTTAADEAASAQEDRHMAEVGRFGVFLPSYIWEGDGPERARGIKAVRPHGGGPRVRLAVHHRPPARRQAVLLGQLAGAADDPGRRGRGDGAGPPGDVDPDHAAAQPGHPGQGAGDAPVPVSDNRVILGAGVGWNEAEYEAVGVKKSERGKRTDEMLDIMMPLLEGETVTYHGQFYSVDDVFIEPRTAQRPLLWIGGGSQLAVAQVAGPAQVRRVGQGAARSRPTAGSRARPARRRTSPATGTSSRRRCARPARTRPTRSSPTRTSCTSS